MEETWRSANILQGEKIYFRSSTSKKIYSERVNLMMIIHHKLIKIIVILIITGIECPITVTMCQTVRLQTQTHIRYRVWNIGQ